jgi:Spy/CpxP family protein refolding chaperone
MKTVSESYYPGKLTMTSSILSGRLALVAAAVVGATALSASAASAQGFKWWQSEMFRRELGLTSEQSAKIEAVFQSTVPVLRREKDALDKAQADFNQMIEASDDAQVMAQVSVVEAARSELNKSRTMMLLRMRRVLTPDQRVKFVMLQQQTRNHGRSGSKR